MILFQRKHALRCYQQALHVYEGKSWHLAEDHINFTLGRQSFNLRQLDDALKSFRQLLVYESQQPPQQQAAYLREFLFVFKVIQFVYDYINRLLDTLRDFLCFLHVALKSS